MSQQIIPRVNAARDDMGEYMNLTRVAEHLRGERAGDLTRAMEARGIRAQEVLSTSDFAYMADTIDRGLKAGYMNEEFPVTYPTIGWRRDSRTFEDAKDVEINAARLVPRVAQGGEYLPNEPAASEYEFTMNKYGWSYALTWEAWLRDQRDLRALVGYPESWGLSVRYTREYQFTSTFVANATLYTGGQGNSGTAALDDAALIAGMTWLRSGTTDPAGNAAPYMGPIHLVVPPALEYTAKALVNSTLLVGSTSQPANNPMYGAASVLVNHMLPVLDETNGDTAWYLFAAPALRPAVRYGFLMGFEAPEVWIRESDARRLLAGGDDPFDGTFDADSIEYKLRFTFGANLVDYRGSYYSTGAA